MNEFRAGVTATLRSWSALKTAVESGWGGHQSKEKADTLRESIYKYMDGTNANLDQIDLEDALAIYMEEEFSVQLEDNSERQIASVLWSMYESCIGRGDVSVCRRVVADANAAILTAGNLTGVDMGAGVGSGGTVRPKSMMEDDDSDDEEMMDGPGQAQHPGSNGAIPLQFDGQQQQQQQQQPHQPQSEPTLTSVSAAQLAAESIFGAPTPTRLPAPTGPVRQLGESTVDPTTKEDEMVDDDGFIAVPQKRKGRKNR